MTVTAPRWGGWKLLAAMLVLGGIGVAVAPFDRTFPWVVPTYFALVLATVEVVRSVRDEPGAWLSRRAVRRALVGAMLAVCASLLVATVWPSPPVLSDVLFMVLVVLNIALGRATQRLATANEGVDERQEALRNRAHRLSYWGLGAGIVGLAVADLATPQSRSWLESALQSGGLIVLAQLLFVLPAMTLAWIEPDHIEPEALPSLSPRVALAAGMVAFTIAAPFLLSLGLVLLPERVSTWTSAPGANGVNNCREFMATDRVGYGVEAAIPLHALVCWDGSHAHEMWGMNPRDCTTYSSGAATVATARCARTTSPDGTLRFTYQTVARPQLLPFLSREVTVGLAIDRNGRVVSFP